MTMNINYEAMCPMNKCSEFGTHQRCFEDLYRFCHYITHQQESALEHFEGEIEKIIAQIREDME